MSRYYVEISKQGKDGYYEFSHSLPISKEEMPFSGERDLNSSGWIMLGYNDYLGLMLFNGDKELTQEEMEQRKLEVKPRFGVKFDMLRFIDTDKCHREVQVREEKEYVIGETYELGKYLGINKTYPWGADYAYNEHKFATKPKDYDGRTPWEINTIFIEKVER